MTKYCGKCGKEIPDNARFCGECGEDQWQFPGTAMTQGFQPLQVSQSPGDFSVSLDDDLDRIKQALIQNRFPLREPEWDPWGLRSAWGEHKIHQKVKELQEDLEDEFLKAVRDSRVSVVRRRLVEQELREAVWMSIRILQYARGMVNELQLSDEARDNFAELMINDIVIPRIKEMVSGGDRAMDLSHEMQEDVIKAALRQTVTKMFQEPRI